MHTKIQTASKSSETAKHLVIHIRKYCPRSQQEKLLTSNRIKFLNLFINMSNSNFKYELKRYLRIALKIKQENIKILEEENILTYHALRVSFNFAYVSFQLK